MNMVGALNPVDFQNLGLVNLLTWSLASGQQKNKNKDKNNATQMHDASFPIHFLGSLDFTGLCVMRET
jgi:hypothetical protein